MAGNPVTVMFRHLFGAVYVLENPAAQRIKVGMTINDVLLRLESVNDMWLERKVTCQVCGGRRMVANQGLIPTHVVSGLSCPGGNALPLEKDVGLAQTYLESMKNRISELSGSEKGTFTRRIQTTAKRIELYRHYKQPVGTWQVRTIFYTKSAEQVELLSHEILAEHLDRSAPFGEVFSCSALQATHAVEAALNRLKLPNFIKEEHISDTVPQL